MTANPSTPPGTQGENPRQVVRRPVPVFVGGCPRSGTTLLGAMLGVGPARLTVPESTFKFRLLPLVPRSGEEVDAVALSDRLGRDPLFRLWGVPVDEVPTASESFAAFMLGLVRGQAAVAGKRDFGLWIDHTPGNLIHALDLARHFPDARFVHVLRDGRAVAASVMPLDWGPNTIAEVARWWSLSVALGFAAERTLGSDRVTTVRFEDLVADPAEELARVCAFLGTPFEPAMVTQRDYAVNAYTAPIHTQVARPPDASRADAWRDDLPARSVEVFEALTGDLLGLLGYEMLYGAGARQSSRFERATSSLHDVIRRTTLDRWRRDARRRGLLSPAASPTSGSEVVSGGAEETGRS